MQLVGPDIATREPLCGVGECLIDVTLVLKTARRRWVGGQRRREIIELTQLWHGLPFDLQRLGSRSRLFLALRDDADKVSLDDDGDDARKMRDRITVNRNETGPDEGSVIYTNIGRSHDAAMKHAVHTHVVDVDQLARHLGWDVNARLPLAHDPVIGCRLHRLLLVQQEMDAPAADQLAERNAEIAVANADTAFRHVQLGDAGS